MNSSPIQRKCKSFFLKTREFLVFTEFDLFINQHLLSSVFRNNLVLYRRYALSTSSYLTLGIFIDEVLKTYIKVFLHNKNDFCLPLSTEALDTLFDESLRRRTKLYFERRSDENGTLPLDATTSFHFVRVFEKLVVGIRDAKNNVRISILSNSWENLQNLKHLIKCYSSQLSNLQTTSVDPNIDKVKSLFENYYYISADDSYIVKKILKSEEVDSNDLTQLELIINCSKRFLNRIAFEKHNTIDSVE